MAWYLLGVSLGGGLLVKYFSGMIVGFSCTPEQLVASGFTVELFGMDAGSVVRRQLFSSS